MAAAKRKRVLAIVATDRTFERRMQGDDPVWVGKCIFCGRNLIVAASGQPISRATIEHIWPRVHGGDDRLENLALACARCNREKGGRHDSGRRDDPRFLAIVAALREKRRARWREPHEELAWVVAAAGQGDASDTPDED